MSSTKPHRLLALAVCVGALVQSSGAGAKPVTLGAPANQDWQLTSAGAFAATQFSLAQLYGDAAPELLAFDREVFGEGESSILVFQTEAPQGAKYQWNFPLYQGGLAGVGDLEGDGDDELIFWRYDEGRQRLRFQVERLRLTESGALGRDTLLVCEELPAAHESLKRDRLPRCPAGGKILTAEQRLVVTAAADFNWRVAPRAILVYDFAGALRQTIRVPNNVFSLRFADLDADGRRDIFLACYASDNGDSCIRGTDSHSYWRVIDLEGRDLLSVAAGGPATMAVTQPLRPGQGAPPLVLASLGESGADELRLYDANGDLRGLRRLPHAMTGVPLVFDQDGDGAEEFLVGMADGTLLLFDAHLGEREPLQFPAAVQPLRAHDLRDDPRPEIFLRVGDQLVVVDAALRVRAVWSGSLTGRLRNPLQQTAAWHTRAGEPRLAAVGLVGREIGFLRLEPNRRPILAALCAGLLGGLLLLAATAIAVLWQRNRRLESRQDAWRAACRRAREAPPTSAVGGERAQVAWSLLAEQLRHFAHSNGDHSTILNNLHRDLERLEADDCTEHRQQVLTRAADVRSALCTLDGAVPAAGALLGDDPVLANLESRLARLTDALARLASGADPADLARDRQLRLGPLASDLQRQLMALRDRVDDCLRPSAFAELHAALQTARAKAGDLPIRYTLSGELDGYRLHEISASALVELLDGLRAIACSCRGPAGRPPLVLAFSVQRESLQLSAELLEAQEGEQTAALWSAFHATQAEKHREPRRDGNRITLRLPLRVPRGALPPERAPRAARAGGALLCLFIALFGASPARAEPSATKVLLPARGLPQLHCADLGGDGRDEILVLLQRGTGESGWSLLEWDGETGRLDSCRVTPAGAWQLLGAMDLDRDGYREPLLIRERPEALELWCRPAPAPCGRPLERRLSLPRLAAATPAARQYALRWHPEATLCALLASSTDSAAPAELSVFSPALTLRWQQLLPARACLDDLADLDGDGRPELLLSLAAGGTRGNLPALTDDCAWSLDLALDIAADPLRAEALGGRESTLRRQLLWEERGPLLGELLILGERTGGDRLEFRPRPAAGPSTRQAGDALLACTGFDQNGDGRPELAIAVSRPGEPGAKLLLLDRDLRELDGLELDELPRALSALDYTSDGIDDLLVLFPRKVQLLDRGLETLALLDLNGTLAEELVKVERVRGSEGVALAALTPDALLLLQLEPWLSGGRRWTLLLLAFMVGLVVGGSAPGLRQRYFRAAAGDWRARARLLGLLLDGRRRDRRGEGIAGLRAALARGEGSAAALLAESLPSLLPDLRQLLDAWSAAGLERRGCAELRRLLDRLDDPDAGRQRAPLAAQLARLAGRQCRLESRLARSLCLDPIAVFRPTLERCQRQDRELDGFSFHLRGGELPPIFFDPAQFEIVCENLILNALRAMADSSPRRLRLDAEVRPDELRLLLEDSGPGVRPELRDRIFEQGVSGGGGRGDGLFIVRGVLAEFGAGIRLIDEPGPLGGARFELRLRRLD